MSVKFSAENLKKFQWLKGRYPTAEAVLLPALRLAEEQFGGIGQEALAYVAELLDLPPAKVFGAFTFYTHFRRRGAGKYLIQVCCTLPCALAGALELWAYLEKELGLKWDPHHPEETTTADGMFTLKKVECLGACGTPPVIQINEDYYENVTPARCDEILAGLRSGHPPPPDAGPSRLKAPDTLAMLVCATESNGGGKQPAEAGNEA